jgi:hypothetical protein
MPMPDAAPQVFDVVLTEEGTQEAIIGRVEADATFRLKVLSAEADQQEFLAETVELLNDKDVLHVKTDPPEGAPRFAVSSLTIERTQPEFLAELQAYLERYYDLTLRPVTAAAH